MTVHSSQGYANTTFGASPPRQAGRTIHGAGRAETPARPAPPSSQRNQPERTVPCVIRVVDGVGVATPVHLAHLLDELVGEALTENVGERA